MSGLFLIQSVWLAFSQESPHNAYGAESFYGQDPPKNVYEKSWRIEGR